MLDPGKAAFIPKKGKSSVVMFVGLQGGPDKPRLPAQFFLIHLLLNSNGHMYFLDLHRKTIWIA
jgi:hypothetical protein